MPDFSLTWVIKFACMSVMAFVVNYTQAEKFSQDDWIRIISTMAGIASIDGGVKAAKSMSGDSVTSQRWLNGAGVCVLLALACHGGSWIVRGEF